MTDGFLRTIIDYGRDPVVTLRVVHVRERAGAPSGSSSLIIGITNPSRNKSGNNRSTERDSLIPCKDGERSSVSPRLSFLSHSLSCWSLCLYLRISRDAIGSSGGIGSSVEVQSSERYNRVGKCPPREPAGDPCTRGISSAVYKRTKIT